MSLQNVGTYDGGIFDGANYGLTKGMGPINTTDAAIANGRALLISELEKRDTKIRQPLTSTTYFRDIPIIVGEGSWVDVISSLEVDYGLTGGSESGPVSASNANDAPVIQMKLGETVYKAHQFRTYIRIGIIDAQRSNYIGRPLDQMLTNGVRLAYDKHMDANAYIGIQKYGSTGLVNNHDVIKSGVATGTNGTTWLKKTPEEILRDINKAITDVWEAAGNDLRALPNHLVIPHQQFSYIATTQLSPHADKTILSFLLENNISKVNGGNLVIGSTAWCRGAGAGNYREFMNKVRDNAAEWREWISAYTLSDDVEFRYYHKRHDGIDLEHIAIVLIYNIAKDVNVELQIKLSKNIPAEYNIINIMLILVNDNEDCAIESSLGAHLVNNFSELKEIINQADLRAEYYARRLKRNYEANKYNLPTKLY